MKMVYDVYEDKVRGCWAGKNIGGVLGAPFEGKRDYFDIDFYTQDLSMGPPPNDDLDLQIIWLAAVERYGRNVNASILGEYWLSYVIPNWVEYGTGKANMRAGLQPPISGLLENTYKDSCGCFIRSEIWACLAPGNPEIAARYAYEDAIVDHQGEGMYGEIFFAAMQSAAFVESDKQKLLEIGLSYIPNDSITTKAIREAMNCYREGVDFKDARVRIHNCAPGTFGIQGCKLGEINQNASKGMEIGAPGFDAPENVAFTIAGWLYGEDDLGKSLCLAVACGEDTDCTAATLGALMGIIQGASNLPNKWTAPLDDKIATLCIDKTWRGIWVPETVEQLTQRVIRTMPLFLGQEICDIYANEKMTILCKEGNDLYCRKEEDYLPFINGGDKDEDLPVNELCSLSPYVVRYSYPAFRMQVDYKGSAFFRYGETRSIKIEVKNSHTMRQQQWAKITLYTPAGIEILGGNSVCLPLNNNVGCKAEVEFEMNTDLYIGAKLELLVEVSLEGRHSSGAAKVVLMREK